MTDYPLPNFHFQVEWGGANISFMEATGLNFETQVIEYRDGASPQYSTQKIPGQQKYSNVTLKQAVFPNDIAFYTWWNTVALNTVERRTVTISLLGPDHQPIIFWTLNNAWPVKVSVPDLKSSANEIAVQSIELAHDGLSVQNA